MALFDSDARRLAERPAVLFPHHPEDALAELLRRYDPAPRVTRDRLAFGNGVLLHGPVQITPTVRFYFRWPSLAAHPGARFDGVHPVKILAVLRLDEVLVAVVAPSSQRRLISASAGLFLDRVAFIDLDRPGPRDWAVAAFTAVSGDAFTGMSST